MWLRWHGMITQGMRREMSRTRMSPSRSTITPSYTLFQSQVRAFSQSSM